MKSAAITSGCHSGNAAMSSLRVPAGGRQRIASNFSMPSESPLRISHA